MSKILGLAPSGFGKTTGIGETHNEARNIHIEGLNPADTYIISVTSKPLPASNDKFPIAKSKSLTDLGNARRYISNSATDIAEVIKILHSTPIRNVIVDDMNYIMQDYYMANALKAGWDAPKKIGYDMGKLFDAFEMYKSPEKHIIVLAHSEDVVKKDGRIYAKLKTTGKMVDEYTTPEGKFDIVLVGVSRWDDTAKRVFKEYVTNENETYSSPKSPIGMFDDLLISNDLGYIVKQVNKFYNVQ